MTNEVGERMITANAPRFLSTIANPTNTAGIMNIEGKKLNVLDFTRNLSSSFG